MPVVSGPGPLFCLLLLLLEPHSPETGRPPLRRFEYKLSFKGPRLALPGAGIPFWSHHGDAILGLEEVRLTPSMRNRSGAVWSRASVLFSAWEVEVQMRVTGLGRRGAQGMVVWYTQGRGHVGSVLGGLASWDGIGIFFDSSAEDTQNSPAIRVLASDGHIPSEQPGYGASQVLGSCHRDFRNRPHPFRARVTYWGQRLRVSLNSGLTSSDPDEFCVDVGPLLLVPGGFFGVSAATGTLADDHDVLSFLTFSLSEPSPEVPPQPFLEMEQLRLARQLEGLRARLGLGTREDVTPKSGSEAQGEGERLFDLEEMLGRHSRILQALRGLSEQLAQAERQWKKQLGPPGQARPDGGWVSSPTGIQGSTCGPERGASTRLALLQDSAKVDALLHGQRTLLQALQEMRDAAVRMAAEAQVSYLPVGTEHHFLELDHILGLLQKELQGPAKAAAKAPRPPGQPPKASSCLHPGIFLFFLLIQTVGFFSYVHFRQELNESLQECLFTGSLPLGPVPHTPRAPGILRRQPLPASMPA
ncbi:PREDICTED: protein ERGIC-53-like [Colobus angolensis palliatus]|uniref:protein ERGIC-53-like n=1 Tax=Colobus angolensis palliatus TaxID=336983 RepID=UPI0005F4E9AF|nr:PREDICTED: protein ERGIC-53-like [Colobus angolensis palliatus]